MSSSWRECHFCGRQVEMAPNQDIGDALGGWIVVSRLHSKDSFERYSFCSLSCLQHWTQGQMPCVPDVFLYSMSDSSCEL